MTQVYNLCGFETCGTPRTRTVGRLEGDVVVGRGSAAGGAEVSGVGGTSGRGETSALATLGLAAVVAAIVGLALCPPLLPPGNRSGNRNWTVSATISIVDRFPEPSLASRSASRAGVNRDGTTLRKIVGAVLPLCAPRPPR